MSRPLAKKIRNSLFVLFLFTLRLIIFFIPLRAASAAGALLGRVLSLVLKKERDIIFKNLEIAYPGRYGLREKRRFASDNFANYGITAFEFLKVNTWKPEAIAKLISGAEGIEHLEAAAAEGRGVIAVTGHFANWELMSVYLSLKGFKVGAIGKKLFDDNVDRFVFKARTTTGVRIYDRDRPSFEMIKGLKNGMILGILSDQDTRVESVDADFLGVRAKTPSAPAVLAKKLGLYIMCVGLLRKKTGLYKMTVNRPIGITEDMATEEIASIYNKQLGDFVEAAPAQWVWVHPRYKSTVDYTKIKA